MNIKENFVQYIFLLYLFTAILAEENISDVNSANITDGQDRYRRSFKPSTPKCRISQYFDKEEGRCLGIPGGGKLINISSNNLCGTHVLKPHCSNSKYYYVCKGNYTILTECATGHEFENRLQKCVVSKTKTLKPLFPHFEDEDLEHIHPPPCSKRGRFPVPGYCNLYYTCESNGHRFHQNVYKCPENQTYDANQQICILSSMAESCLKNTLQTCVPVETISSTETNKTIGIESPNNGQSNTTEEISTGLEYPLEVGTATTSNYYEVTDTTTEEFVPNTSEIEVSEYSHETTVSYDNEDIPSTIFTDSYFSSTTETNADSSDSNNAPVSEVTTIPQNSATETVALQTKFDIEDTTHLPETPSGGMASIVEEYFESTTENLSTPTEANYYDKYVTEEPVVHNTVGVISETDSPRDELDVDYSTSIPDYPNSDDQYTIASTTIAEDNSLEMTSETPTDYEANDETFSDQDESNNTTESISPNSSEIDPTTTLPDVPYGLYFRSKYDSNQESVSTTSPNEINDSELSFPSTESNLEEVTPELNEPITPSAISKTQLSENNEDDTPKTFVPEWNHLHSERQRLARTRLPIASAIMNITATLENSIREIFRGFAREFGE